MSETVQCKICYEDYNETDRLPRLISSCGHTLCSLCLKNIINQNPKTNKLVCPIDRKIIDEKSFSINYDLLDVISNKKKLTMCDIHNKPEEFYCLEDNTKICSHCALKGFHSGHNIETLEEIEKKIQISLKDLEKLSDKVWRLEEEANEMIVKNKEELVACVEKEFDVYINKCVRHLEKQKEKVLRKIDRIYNQEVQDNGLFKEIENQKAMLQIRSEDLKSFNFKAEILLQDVSELHVEEGIDKLKAALEKSFERIKIIPNSNVIPALNKFCYIYREHDNLSRNGNSEISESIKKELWDNEEQGLKEEIK